jgi:hypothetical protein
MAVRQGDKALCLVLPYPITPQWVVVPFRGVQSPRVWIFDVVLTVWIPVLPNLTWRILLLPGRAYPMLEPSW